jgi:hypothetical protein
MVANACERLFRRSGFSQAECCRFEPGIPLPPNSAKAGEFSAGDARGEIAGFERLQRALHLRPEQPAYVCLLLTVSR